MNGPLSAVNTFKEVGKQLKTRRVEDDMEDMYAYLPDHNVTDPADQVMLTSFCA